LPRKTNETLLRVANGFGRGLLTRGAIVVLQVGVGAAPVGFWSWAPESKISVYVAESDFKPDELEYLLAPLSPWNAVSETTGSRVEFEYKGLVNGPRYCENCVTIVRDRW
jgi:hypothetical protein